MGLRPLEPPMQNVRTVPIHRPPTFCCGCRRLTGVEPREYHLISCKNILEQIRLGLVEEADPTERWVRRYK